MSIRYTHIIIILLLFPATIFAQDKISFKRLTAAEGLSNNWVRNISMDDIGYMWFCTADGLNKYDGNTFKIYRPLTANGKEIGNINVSAVLKKSQYELWVCTDLGVYIYSYLDDYLQRFEEIRSMAVLCAMEDHEGNVWFGTSAGLYRYDLSDEKITHYVHEPDDESSISDNFINSLLEDSNGNVWIGTQDGLNLYNSLSESFIQFYTGGLNGTSTSDIMGLCEDHYKRIWVGDFNNGVFVFEITKPGNIRFEMVNKSKVIHLKADSRNYLWIASSFGNGLTRIDLEKYKMGETPVLENFENNIRDIHSLSDNSIFCVYEDRFHDIWIGTYGGGINYFSPRSKKFHSVSQLPSDNNSIQHDLINAFSDDEDNIYVGTEGGLDILNKKTRRFTHLATPSDRTISGIPIYSLYKDSRENLWIGTWANGLNVYNIETNTIRRFLPDNKPGSMSNANIFSIFEDNRGYIWAATIGGGLNRYDYKTGDFTVYKTITGDPESLYGNNVNHVFQTSDGKLLISLENSLDMYDYERDCFIHFLHNTEDKNKDFGNILSVFEDSRKNLWIATNAGLELFDFNTREFISVISGDMIPGQAIQGILEDGHGNLWLSTNKGITKYINGITIPEKPIFHNYTQEDGISGNEFKKRAAYKTRDGYMLFGSSMGYTWFHPDSIKINSIPPQVILSDFILLTSPKNGKYSNLNVHVNYLDTIELSHRNADFQISFAALNYLNPQNNLFRYKLDGYDSDWKSADGIPTAHYTNLNHGTYTFMVMASNNDGVWTTQPRKLIIIIHPPWWETMVFRMFIISSFIMLLLGVYKLRFRMLENQKKELEAIVNDRTKELLDINEILEQKQEEITLQFEELSVYKTQLEKIVEERTADLKGAKEKAEESDRLKTAFLQNMSHEIRTPLNAIMGFSSLLDENFDDRETLISFSTIINQKGQDLLDIINGILDISKIEAGSLAINNERCSIDSLITELHLFFTEFRRRSEKEHIDMHFNNDSGVHYDIVLDAGKLKQVIINIVSNAFKFTKIGSITLSCTSEGRNLLRFHVTDTGIGIPTDKQSLIFERFRQINEFHYHEGTGLGLSISKGIIELLGGEIWLTSEEGKGTTFYFTVPFKPAG